MANTQHPQIIVSTNDRGWTEVPFDSLFSRISETSEKFGLPRVEYEDIESGKGVLNKDVFKKISRKKGLKFEGGDILFGKLRPYLKNDIIATFEGIAVGDFWILRPKENHNGTFLFYILENRKFQSIANTSSGTKMPRADWAYVSSSKLYVPSKEAQEDIARFISQLDCSIKLSESELHKFKQLKKAYRHMLFPKDGSTRPQVRFKKYNSEWEEKPLSHFLSIKSEIAGSNFTKENVLSVSGEYGIVNQIAFQGRSFAGASISNYRVVKKGNVVYTKSPLKANPYGIVKAATKEEGIVSPLYAVYETTSEADPVFVQVFFDDDVILNNYLRPLINKGAKNTIQISDETAISGTVVFPEVEEQQEIAKFFLALDDLIATHTRELEALKHIKAACLDGMFVNE